MEERNITILGLPNGNGAGVDGCQLGPDMLRVSGFNAMLRELGCQVEDKGNLSPANSDPIDNPHGVKNLEQAIAWSSLIKRQAYQVCGQKGLPIFLGGDHSISFGTVAGVSQYAEESGRPLFVLWIDAHTDFHSLNTSDSGNIHGMPLAYLSGDTSFKRWFPEINNPLKPENICVMGIRSVDPAERRKLSSAGIIAHDMRKIDEMGVISLLEEFLQMVRRQNGLLHVSLDVDALDPSIAPAVGTTVPGGLTFREAHIMMEILHDSGLVTSLDLVELNPLLDEAAKTARLLTDLTASLLGRSVLG